MKTYLGIDVGSISTKLVLIDTNNNVLFSLYIRTEGNPIGAAQRGLKELKKYVEEKNPTVEIAGVGTTGSARYLVGVITGADLVKNEITAHAKGVSYFVPDTRTVIEIGGQDSKIIILENGVAVDFAMNLVCITKDAQIITENYVPKSINNIKIGDMVLTHKGRFKAVKKVFERDYQGKMLRMAISNLRTLKITPEHPVLALRREDIKCYQDYSRGNTPVCKPQEERSCNKRCAKYKNFSWEPKFIPAKELKRDDFIAVPLSVENDLIDPPLINYDLVKTEISIPRPFNKIDELVFDNDLLRLLGYYLAEGNIGYNRARWNQNLKYPCGIVFTFNIREKEYADDIKKIIGKKFPEVKVTFFEKPKQKSLVVWIYSKSLAEYIKYLCGSYAGKKQLSPELLSLEPSLQKEIIKGFFRGDGHFRKRPKNISGSNKKGNRYCAVTVSEVLAHQLYFLLLRNKIKCTLNKARNKTKGGKYAYSIEIFGKEINKLDDIQAVSPKKDGHKSFIYSQWLFEPIKQIKEYNLKGKVYNLETEEDNSYVANTLTVHNCSAGTGAFLDAQSFRLKVPIENFGDLALKSKHPTNIGARCTVFSESDMIHKQQMGHPVEDIIAGLCQGLVRNYLNNVAKGKNIQPPIVFLGGVSQNIGMRKAFEEALGQSIIIPEYNTVMGALGVALLVKEMALLKTKFFGFEISDKDVKCTSFQCQGCPNHCEVIEARIEGKVIARWGDRCGKWSNLNPTDSA